MAFWRVRGQAISLLHGRRTDGGVKQKLLHTFASFDDLSKALETENWARFTQSVEQAHPRVAPKWKEVRDQGLRLLQQAQPQTAAPSDQDELNKVRKALRFVTRAIYPSVMQPVDESKTVALAPELLECLEAGLLRLHGRNERAVEYMVPNMEKTDAMVEEARREYHRNSARGIRFFKAARDYNPYDPDVLNSWGICHYESNQLNKALELFQQAREMARVQLPDVDRVYSWGNLRIRPYLRATSNLALVRAKQGHHQEALDLYLHCLERCPDDGLGVRFQMGNLYEHLGRLEEGLRSAREERGSGWVERPDAHYDGARMLVKLGRPEEAVGWLLRGISINPFIPSALQSKAKCQRTDLATVDSVDWAIGYADDSRALWTGAPKKWLSKLCKDEQLSHLMEEYRAALLVKSSWGQREELAQAILLLEERLKN